MGPTCVRGRRTSSRLRRFKDQGTTPTGGVGQTLDYGADPLGRHFYEGSGVYLRLRSVSSGVGPVGGVG